ncbi:DUF5789 family protein [Natrarchaeobaculum aegyptiacum]|uniref:DUF2795 domain-containing protein n=1 Tax=Natrarchaeobaculum aegyptiacum TaxID=745377 RepID=A0A2Z2HPA7_9EURY|nr:hypothetical protein [Natrarchaeobaculum aegyptiacum]ARS88856.1 hypothetical protein B1756_03200 [Natrarchaeobaculum aegyptiacum]
MSDDGPNRDRVQDRAEERKSERAAGTESILEAVGTRIDDLDLEYPVTSEEIAAEYGNDPIDVSNETESLGSVFDRLAGETYDDPEEVREAVYGELTGQAGSASEANPERDLTSLDAEKQGSPSERGGDAL